MELESFDKVGPRNWVVDRNRIEAMYGRLKATCFNNFAGIPKRIRRATQIILVRKGDVS